MQKSKETERHKQQFTQQKFIDAIYSGIEEQHKSDTNVINLVARIEYPKGSNVLAETEKAKGVAHKCHEEDINFKEYAIDDVSGDQLDPNEVRKSKSG